MPVTSCCSPPGKRYLRPTPRSQPSFLRSWLPSFARSLAFSAYGEQAFLLFQNLVLLILIYYFSKQTSRLVYASSGYAALVALLASGAQHSTRAWRLAADALQER